MDRESLNDFPLGKYDVTVHIITFERDREIAWNLGPDIPVAHFYGYRLEPGDDGDHQRHVVLRLVEVRRRHQGALPGRAGVGAACDARDPRANGPPSTVTERCVRTGVHRVS